MASVFDVAQYILRELGTISTWKLQKLCYYSQAWSLAWTGKPLFSEEFEAWSNGPVCRELYNEHRGYYSVGAKDIKRGNPDELNSDEKDTINVVLRDYGGMEAYELRELTHSETPWLKARNGLPDGASSDAIITKAAMSEYYGAL